MIKTTDYFAETIDINALPNIINDTLKSLRISGNLLLRESYALPWSIAIPDAESLGQLLDVPPTARAVAFHLVEFGHCTIKQDNGEELLLKAGEMAICFGGDAHVLGQGKTVKAQPFETLLRGGPNIQRLENDASHDGASMLCGVFLLQHPQFNPLVEAMPSIMHASLSRPGEMHNLSGVARLMAEQIDRQSIVGNYVVERLLEVLCAEAMRAYIETERSLKTGWLRGIKDPVINRAIDAIHANPGDNWSVQRLADDVAMSPSRFAARFADSVGNSPMAYTTKWRMNLACRDLSSTQNSIGSIASSVGYESAAAFSRAFKKHVGVSPATWRTRFLRSRVA